MLVEGSIPESCPKSEQRPDDHNGDLLVLEFAVRSAAGFLFLPKESIQCNFASSQICKSRLRSEVKNCSVRSWDGSQARSASRLNLSGGGSLLKRLHAREQDLPSSLQLVALPSRTGEEKTRFLLKLKDAPRAQEADQPDLAKH